MFNLELYHDGADAVFHLQGVQSLEDTANLRKAFWDVMNQHPMQRLIVNFEHVPQIDSAVISLLVATKNAVTRFQATMILVGLADSHRNFLEKTQLHRYFEIQPDLASCLAIKK